MPISTITPASLGGVPAFSAYQSSSQTLSSQTFTLIQFQTKEFDTNTCFNNTSSTATLNGLSAPAWSFCPNVAGYYQISFGVSPGTSATSIISSLYKNGAQFKTPYYSITAVSATSSGSVIIYFNGTGDYVQLYSWFLNGQGTSNTNYYTYFQAAMIRSA